MINVRIVGHDDNLVMLAAHSEGSYTFKACSQPYSRSQFRLHERADPLIRMLRYPHASHGCAMARWLTFVDEIKTKPISMWVVANKLTLMRLVDSCIGQPP